MTHSIDLLIQVQPPALVESTFLLELGQNITGDEAERRTLICTPIVTIQSLDSQLNML